MINSIDLQIQICRAGKSIPFSPFPFYATAVTTSLLFLEPHQIDLKNQLDNDEKYPNE
jgi:hypothetical protein